MDRIGVHRGQGPLYGSGVDYEFPSCVEDLVSVGEVRSLVDEGVTRGIGLSHGPPDLCKTNNCVGSSTYFIIQSLVVTSPLPVASLGTFFYHPLSL